MHIFSDQESLKKFLPPNNLLVEIGGKADFDLKDWIAERCRIEGVSIDDLECTPHVKYDPPPISDKSLLLVLSDPSVKQAEQGAIKKGALKKQGGVVRRYNRRWCVLREEVLFYYRTENDDIPEGYVMLRGATVMNNESKGKVFCIRTAAQKECLFAAASDKELRKWVKKINDVIHDGQN